MATHTHTKVQRLSSRLSFRQHDGGGTRREPVSLISDFTAHAHMQEFCRIYRQYFPFGSSDILASLIFKAFPPEKDGTVGFKQFVVNLSVVLRGSTDETLKCEILCQ